MSEVTGRRRRRLATEQGCGSHTGPFGKIENIIPNERMIILLPQQALAFNIPDRLSSASFS
jgi:hypothetical protein